MPTVVLDPPIAPCNAPKVARPVAECNPPSDDGTQDDPSASEILEGWVVQIPSRLINSDLGALIVLALATAWRIVACRGSRRADGRGLAGRRQGTGTGGASARFHLA